MPVEYNGKIGVTVNEILPFFSSYYVIEKRLRDGMFIRIRLGGNGRVLLMDFDSMPTEIQHAIGDPRLVKHIFEKYYRNDNEARRFYTQYKLENGFYLATELQDKYILNAGVLRAVLGFRTDLEKRNNKGLNTKGVDEVLLNHTITFQQTLKAKHNTEHTLPGSLKRFKEVLKAFEKKGYVSLISGKIGNNNSRKVTDDVMALLESMFAKATIKPSPIEVSRQYNKFLVGHLEIINNGTGEIYAPAEFKELSEYTINKYLTGWKSAIATYSARSGDRQKYMQGYKPYASLDKPTKAGSLLSIDDRQPPFVMLNGKRIWLYVGIDVASGACVCIVAARTKEAMILEFYRQLVRNYAEWGLSLPDGLEAESSLNSSFTNTFLAEGAMFENVRIEANNARGKIIENFNGRMRYGLEKIEANWNARPHARRESNQAGSRKVEAMDYKDIVALCFKNYETWNNMPHDTEPDLCRWEFFMERQHPDLKPINYNAILPYLGFKTRTSCRTGIIKLDRSEYILGDNGEVCLGDKLISLMERVEGHDIDVYWLDDNNGKIFKALVYIGTLLICEAVVKPRFNRAKIEQSDEDRKAMAVMSSYITTIEAYGRRRKKGIEAVTIIDNTPKPERKFKMPGLKYYDPSDIKSGGLLPEPAEFDKPIQSFVKPLDQRF
ncbi:hypothetical protein [Mucilaginibacter sp.]|uniref:hypothetical protein n=1 Tax=Mucilaginibacter sp. TaxID=1882438 RepID=UPI002604955F|nr:hypothetical protein [Mucilaginibacter sp.]MDB5029714.1 hypothetical protein [Mucilaginibacter sp.]